MKYLLWFMVYSYLTVLIVMIYGVKKTNKSKKEKIINVLHSIWLSLILVLFPVLPMIFWYKNNKETWKLKKQIKEIKSNENI